MPIAADVPLVPAASAVVFDGQGRLLLVQRRNEPEAGRWSIPGGKCHPGESTAQACVREVAEETGLHIELVRSLGTVERDGAQVRYVIEDFLARVVSGDLHAGDDASDACWADADRLRSLTLVAGLVQTLTEWGISVPTADAGLTRD